MWCYGVVMDESKSKSWPDINRKKKLKTVNVLKIASLENCKKIFGVFVTSYHDCFEYFDISIELEGILIKVDNG